MNRYRARPIEIEAVLWQGDMADLPQEWLTYIVTYEVDSGILFTRTLQGPSRAEPGKHYLVANHDHDEVYPVTVPVFERRYEQVQP